MRPLCRYEGHTCGACCWGENVTRAALTRRLRRQSDLFRRWFPPARLPDGRRLLLYEVLARWGLDLLLALFLCVPALSDWLRPRLQRPMVCAFLAFEDDGQTRVGCLLHPSRWQGREIRPQSAFRLLRGFSCGAPDYFCLAAHWFAAVGWEAKRDFGRRTAGMDWYQFSNAARAYRPRASSEKHRLRD